jgi:hypothetical protein
MRSIFVQHLCSICLQTGLYNLPVLPALRILTQEISIFATFPRPSPLPTPNSFSMAAINLDRVQFWVPPSNSFLHKQRTASSHGTSKSLCTTSSRNRLAPLYNQATQIFKCNGQSTSAIAMVRHQADESAAGAQGKIRENTRNKPS